MKKQSIISGSLLFICLLGYQLTWSQDDTSLRIKNIDGSYSVQQQASGKQEVPAVMGGGEAPANSLKIASPNWRGGKQITPESLGVDNLIAVKWLDKKHFLFVGTDAVDIQDYFIYLPQEEKIYKCDFAVGERIGYGEFDKEATFEFTIEDEIITDFRVK